MTILVVGDANADVSAALVHYPAEGDDTQITTLEWGSGGSAANVAAALARLGTPTRLLARVGSDPAADIALRVARAAGVDLSAVQTDPAIATGLCYAAVSPGGDRTFFSFRGANTTLTVPAPALHSDTRWLHIAGHALFEGQQRETARALFDAAVQQNVPISVDLCLPTLRAWRSEIVMLLPDMALLFANELELAELYPGSTHDSAIAQLQRTGVPLAAIKLGAGGCLVATPDTQTHTPACPVAAIDTNGCGDAFVAGFLHAQLRGAALEHHMLLANALGALTATRYGAAEALPTRHELHAFLNAQPGGAIVAAQILSS